MATSRLKARKPEEVTPGKIKGIIFGPPGAGKTWLALSFPEVYFIDPEGGADLPRYQRRLAESGGAYFGKKDGASDPKAVLDEIRSLATEKHAYKTLVIDSASKLFNSIIGAEAERLGEADAWGKSKKPAIAWARSLSTWIDRVDMNVWLVCHEIPKWEAEKGKERQEIGKQPDIWEKLSYDLHLQLRVVQIGKGNRECVIGKSRLEGFTEFDRFYTQRNGEDVAYKHFTERYSRDFIEAAVVPVKLASAEQIAEMLQLLEVVRIPDEEKEKWFAKAGVTSFEEFTEEQLAKSINYVKGKLPTNTQPAINPQPATN